jgi:hypothetical protein
MQSVGTLLAASKAQDEHLLSLAFTDLQSSHVQQEPVETRIGQRALLEATIIQSLLLTIRHAHDAVFEEWSDGVLDMPWNLWS